MPASQKRRLSPTIESPLIQASLAAAPALQPLQGQQLQQEAKRQRLLAPGTSTRRPLNPANRKPQQQQVLLQQPLLQPCAVSGRKRFLPHEEILGKSCRIKTNQEVTVPLALESSATAGDAAATATPEGAAQGPPVGPPRPPEGVSSCVALVPYVENRIYEPLLRPLQQQQELLLHQKACHPIAALAELHKEQQQTERLTAAAAVEREGVLLLPGAAPAANEPDDLLQAQEQQEETQQQEDEDDDGLLLRTISQSSVGAMSVD